MLMYGNYKRVRHFNQIKENVANDIIKIKYKNILEKKMYIKEIATSYHALPNCICP